jgi:hypothetical protein
MTVFALSQVNRPRYDGSIGSWLRRSRTQFTQHLVGRHEERILLQDAANNHHRVCPHDVHHHVGPKLGQIVGSAHCVVVLGEDVVQAGFVLHDVLDTGTILERPLHIGDQAGEHKPLGFAGL